MEVIIERANRDDLDQVLALLKEAGLPTEGVKEHFENFLVAREEEKIVGCVGLEDYGPSALFRSLAIAPAYRNRGLGTQLTEAILKEARRRGIKKVFLLTETAEEYFPRFGFRAITWDEADPAVKQSVQFKTCCSEKDVCMRLDLS